MDLGQRRLLPFRSRLRPAHPKADRHRSPQGQKGCPRCSGRLTLLSGYGYGASVRMGDNDRGQQGNGSTTVNRRPALVQSLEGVAINRVARGSSHSVAWVLQDMQTVSRQDPVVFLVTKDPLGASLLGLYDNEKPM